MTMKIAAATFRDDPSVRAEIWAELGEDERKSIIADHVIALQMHARRRRKDKKPAPPPGVPVPAPALPKQAKHLKRIYDALAGAGYLGLLDLEKMTGTPANSVKGSVEWFKKRDMIEYGPRLRRVGANGQVYEYQSYALRRETP